MADTDPTSRFNNGAALHFEVIGTPVPKGSTKAFFRPGMRYPVVTADNKKTRPWQESVVTAALEAQGKSPLQLAGPVTVFLDFFLPRPKSTPRRIQYPTKKPDIDKLERAILDGLTRAGIWLDDAQVVQVLKRKAFAGGLQDPVGEHGLPRCYIRVAPAEELLYVAPVERTRMLEF